MVTNITTSGAFPHHTKGCVLAAIALIVGIAATALLTMGALRYQEASYLDHSLGLLPFPEAQEMISAQRALAQTLLIAGGVAAGCSIVLGAAALTLMKKSPEESWKSRALKVATLTFGIITLVLFIQGQIRLKETSYIDHTFGTIPLAPMQTLVAQEQMLAMALTYGAAIGAGATLACAALAYKTHKASLLPDTELPWRKWLRYACMFGALAGLIFTITFVGEGIARAYEAAHFRDTLGKIPIDFIQDFNDDQKDIVGLFFYWSNLTALSTIALSTIAHMLRQHQSSSVAAA